MPCSYVDSLGGLRLSRKYVLWWEGKQFLQQETLGNLLWVLLYVLSGNSMCLTSLPCHEQHGTEAGGGGGGGLSLLAYRKGTDRVWSVRERGNMGLSGEQRKKVPLLSLQKRSLPLNNNFKKCVWYIVLRIHFLRVLNLYYFCIHSFIYNMTEGKYGKYNWSNSFVMAKSFSI